ncbi:glycosyltransferase family 39 protein [Rudaeicoccus suwonensis]|uniref:Dolichyl-phosphate-mannose-protein mannosyltransferase n=1 Tax=Rudaeicoccus suwonensis TaxID=657409 RepID=A0A561E6U0_9MICO|nr:glycosyltransferase family 39 protein [Rudaeicoccus suwonensis]TWE11322.1 dolichyl-phosphate-mannose-protein mannosyltransferase [Rudaeicoccus suwonensis]
MPSTNPPSDTTPPVPGDPGAADPSARSGTCPSRIGWCWAGIAICIGLIASWVPGYWYDESASISAARRPLPALIGMLHHLDLVHSQFYFFLHFWSAAFGWSTFATRAPSAVVYGVCTYVVWRLADRWFGPLAASAAAATFVILPGSAWTALEARGFAMAMMWLLLATWCLVGARESRWRWIGYVALMLLACWGEIYVLMAIVAHALIARHTRRFRPWLIAAVVMSVLVAPFFVAASRQTGQLGGQAGFGLSGLPGTVLHSTFFVGPHDPHSPVPGLMLGSYLAMAVVLALVIVALVTASRGRGSAAAASTSPASAPPTSAPPTSPASASSASASSASASSSSAPLAWALAVWALLPPVATFVISLRDSGAMYSTRYFAFCCPALAILAGAGVAVLRGRWLRVGVMALVILGCLPLLVAKRTPTGKAGQNFAAVAHDVTRLRPDAVVYDDPRARAPSVAYPAAFAGLPDLSLAQGRIASDSLFGTDRTPGQIAALARDGGYGRIALVTWGSPRGAVLDALRGIGCQVTTTWTSIKVDVTDLSCP